jgi:integrase
MAKGNPQGSIELHNGKLRVVIRLAGNKHYIPTGMPGTKAGYAVAEIARKEAIESIENGNFNKILLALPQATATIDLTRTLNDYADSWIASLKGSQNRDGNPFKDSSILRYGRLLLRWRIALGDRRMSSLTSADIRSAYQAVTEGLKPNTVTAVLMIGKKLLRQAATEGWVSSSVAEGMKTPIYAKPQLDHDGTWNLEESAKLMELATGIDKAFGRFVSLGLMMGMRNGEIRALRLEDIDMRAKILRIRRTATEDYQGTRSTGDLKTKRSRRDLDFSDTVRDILAEQVLEVTGKSEWLFPNDLDAKVPASYWALRKKMVELGESIGRYLPPHRLRHTFATTALTNGATIHEVAAYMGDTQATVEAHYAAWTEQGARRKAALRFGSMYDSSPKRPPATKLSS